MSNGMEAVAASREDLADERAAAASLKELESGAKPLSLEALDEYLARTGVEPLPARDL